MAFLRELNILSCFRKPGTLVLFGFILAFGMRTFIPGDSSTYLDEEKEFHAQYYKLERYLRVYEIMASNGGWDKLPLVDDTITIGMADPVIPMLRERLDKENYLPLKFSGKVKRLDPITSDALEQFQRDHKLEPSGTLNRATINALNISAKKKAQQLKANLSRWKEFPKEPGMEHIFINVADFRLDAVKYGTSVLSMKVIVGRKSRQTPEFSALLTHVVFNPSWHIPPGILRNDVLPVASRDPSYLRRRNMRIFGKGKDGRTVEIPRSSVDWSKASRGRFPYSIVQDPGPNNPLGVVAFKFPNPYYVYLHDTPSRHLFESDQPTFSSGCIRGEKAVELSVLILQRLEGWDEKKIDETIQTKRTHRVNLEKPINVYVTYFTAWVNDKGHLQFRKDFYNKD